MCCVAPDLVILAEDALNCDRYPGKAIKGVDDKSQEHTQIKLVFG